MKRKLTALALFAAMILAAGVAMAQAPQKISYQAVVRDANGRIAAGQQVSLKITIKNIVSDEVVYTETATGVQTNANGLLTYEIGTNGNISLKSINWANGNYQITSAIDPANGTNYIEATSRILSVPYAFHANTADSLIGLDAKLAALKAEVLAATGSNATVVALQDELNNLTITTIPALETRIAALETGKADASELANYAKLTDLPDVSNFATTDQIPDVSGFATTEAMDEEVAALNEKIDELEIPTEQEIEAQITEALEPYAQTEDVDAKLAEKADVTALADYAKAEDVYAKTETYTQDEVNDLVSALEARVEDAEENVNAAVTRVNDAATNMANQENRIHDLEGKVEDLEGKAEDYESRISAIEASDYVQSSDIEDFIAADALTDYAKTDDVETKLADYAKSEDVYTKDDVDTKLEDYATKEDLEDYKATVDEVLDSMRDAETRLQISITNIANHETRIGVIEQKFDTIAGLVEDVKALQDANGEIDDKISDAVDAAVEEFITEAEVDSKLEDYAKTADVYTTDVLDEKLDEKANADEVNQALDSKVDNVTLQADYYTKADVDQKIADEAASKNDFDSFVLDVDVETIARKEALENETEARKDADNELDGRISEIEDANYDTRVAALETLANSFEEAVENLNEKSDLAETRANNLQAVETNLTTMVLAQNIRMDQMDERMGEMEETMSEISDTFEDINDRLDAIDGEDGAIEKLTAKDEELEAKTDSIITVIDSVAGVVREEFAAADEDLQGQIDNINDLLDGDIDQRFEDIEQSIEDLKDGSDMTIASLDEKIDDLKQENDEKFATFDTLAYFLGETFMDVDDENFATLSDTLNAINEHFVRIDTALVYIDEEDEDNVITLKDSIARLQAGVNAILGYTPVYNDDDELITITDSINALNARLAAVENANIFAIDEDENDTIFVKDSIGNLNKYINARLYGSDAAAETYAENALDDDDNVISIIDTINRTKEAVMSALTGAYDTLSGVLQTVYGEFNDFDELEGLYFKNADDEVVTIKDTINNITNRINEFYTEEFVPATVDINALKRIIGEYDTTDDYRTLNDTVAFFLDSINKLGELITSLQAQIEELQTNTGDTVRTVAKWAHDTIDVVYGKIRNDSIALSLKESGDSIRIARKLDSIDSAYTAYISYVKNNLVGSEATAMLNYTDGKYVFNKVAKFNQGIEVGLALNMGAALAGATVSGGNTLTGIKDPEGELDAASKRYVDTMIKGIIKLMQAGSTDWSSQSIETVKTKGEE